jgi:hypothetical protein
VIEDRPDELFFGRGNVRPEHVLSFYHLKPLLLGRCLLLGQSVVEEGLDSCLFAFIVWVVGNKAYETACRVSQLAMRSVSSTTTITVLQTYFAHRRYLVQFHQSVNTVHG